MQLSPLVLAPLLTLATAAGMATYAGRGTERRGTRRVYLALLLSLIVAAITGLGMLADRSIGAQHDSPYGNGLLFLTALVFGSKILLHLIVVRSTDGRNAEPVSFRYFLPLYLPAAILACLLWFTPLLVAGFERLGAFLVPVKGPYYEFLMVWLIGTQLIGLGLLIHGARHAGSSSARQRDSLLAMGLAVPVMGLVAIQFLPDQGFAALALFWPAVMSLYLATAAPVLFGDRLPDPGFHVPGSRHRQERIAFYGRLREAAAALASANSSEFAVQELARVFGAPVILRASDGRQVAASPAYNNRPASLPASLLPPCRHLLLSNDNGVAPALRRAMVHYGVDAIIPLYPYADGAAGWLLIGAPFRSLVVSLRDVREAAQLFDRVAELVLEQLVAMRQGAEQRERLALELNQARQRLETENESLRRENARLLREHPADTFSLISTASQDVVIPPTITVLGRDKTLLRVLKPCFPQLAHYVGPGSDGFRKQHSPEVLICHIPTPDPRRDGQIVRLIREDRGNTVFLLYGDGARPLMEHRYREMLGHIVALLPGSLTGEALGNWIHGMTAMRRAVLAIGTADCPLMGRSQVFIDLIADAVRASRFLEPIMINAAGSEEILALARFIHEKSGGARMAVVHTRPLGQPGPDQQRTGERELDEAIRTARGGTLVLEDAGRVARPDLDRLVKRVLDLGDVRLIAGLTRRGDLPAPRLPAELALFSLDIPALHERRVDLPLLTLYYEMLYNLRAAADGYLNPLEIESLLEANQLDTQAGLKTLVFEQLGERPRAAGQTVYPEPGGTGKTLDEHVAEFEAELIRRTLEQCGGNKSKTARLLGLRPNTLHYKMVRHGLAGNRRKLDD
jgi:hypothetical protein